MKLLHLKITAFLILFCLSHSVVAAAGAWKTHHPIGRQVIRVIDGERYAYFIVHGNPYDSKIEGNNELSVAAFRADKSLPDACITPLAAEQQLSGDAILAEEYNPVKKYLCVLHTNGMIDLVYDSGRVETVSAFADNPFPGPHTVGSITFAPQSNEIFLATDGGYMVIDDEELSLLYMAATDCKVEWIARAGNEIISFAGGNAYISSGYPDSFNEEGLLRPDTSDAGGALLRNGLLPNPKKLMPLTERSFAFLALKSGTTYDLNVALRDDTGKWHIRNVAGQTIVSVPATQRRHDILEGCASPVRDGYFFSGQSDIFLLNANEKPDFSLSDPAGEYAARVARKLKKPTMNPDDPCASWDFRDVWAYAAFQGFYSTDAEGAGTIVPCSMPDAPLTTFCRTLVHNPAHGLLAMNRGLDYLYSTYGGEWGLMLSALKGNNWTNLSPSWHRPAGISDSDWTKAANSYPGKNPNGLAVDPDNPDYVYITSSFHGIARLNLADISAPVLHWSKAGDPTAVIPGFAEISPANYLCWFARPAFDEEGNLWVPYFNFGKFRDGYYLEIWILPREKRLALEADAATAATQKDIWTIVPVKAAHTATNKIFNTLLRHPDNSGIMMFSPIVLGESLAIYSSGDDLMDTGDDLSVLYHLPETPDGQKINDTYVYSITEDPATGRVWIGSDSGLFSVSPRDILEGKSTVSETFSVTDGSGGPAYDPFEHSTVTSMVFDPLGRVWVGTMGDGLLCVSADRTTLLEQFDADNSPLADNSVTALEWNATNGSLAISTLHGLSEYFPDGSKETADTASTVWPDVVRPDYFGRVAISGLPVGEEIVILDSTGSETASLGVCTGGVAYWHPLSDGRRVASGKYRVATADGHRTLAEIKVMN